MQIKICGITNKSDALHAVQSGATHIGLIFVEDSSRFITLPEARAITSAVAGRALVVGVFQNHDTETIARTVIEAGLDAVQLHGQETPEFCRSIALRLGKPVIKTLVLQGNESAEALSEQITAYTDNLGPEAIILFDRAKSISGAQWLDSALSLVGALERKAREQERKALPDYFFAGGLNGKNLDQVFSSITPAGVDVASGVEKSPGQKEPALVEAFINRAKQNNSMLRSKK